MIKYQIKANYYITDEDTFKFDDIKEEFENYGNYLLKEKEKKINKMKSIINENNYGLSI